MVLIYGEGTFDNYRAALGAVGIETVVSMDTALAQRCGGLPGDTLTFYDHEWIRICLAKVKY